VCVCVRACVRVCVCVARPLLVMESHGECEIKVQLNCSHCETQSCARDEDSHLLLCLCHNEEVPASDNVTCTGRCWAENSAAGLFETN